MTSPPPPPTTLYAALEQHHLPPDHIAQWKPYGAMIKRFIGEVPTFLPLLALSPTACRSLFGLFARCFHAPMVDMRVPGYLTPPLRRVAFLIASRDFSCTYCTAHACAFGDMFLGSVPAQVSRGAQSAADLPDSPASRAIQALASAAVRRPLHDGQGNQDLSHLIGTASEILGPLALEITKAVIAFSGFLNTIMDVQGVPLEPHAQTFAASHMPVGTDGTPWAVGEYHGNASRAAADTDVYKSSIMSNLRCLVLTMPPAIMTMWYEMFTLYAKVPMRAERLDAWVRERLGSRSSVFFGNINGTELKRAFCFGLRENILIEEVEEVAGVNVPNWSQSERIMFLHMFGTVTQSEYLKEVAMYLHSEPATLNCFSNRTCDEGLEPHMAAARRLVVAEATRLDNISPALILELTSTCSPSAIMDLASLLAFFEFWRRMALLFNVS